MCEIWRLAIVEDTGAFVAVLKGHRVSFLPFILLIRLKQIRLISEILLEGHWHDWIPSEASHVSGRLYRLGWVDISAAA